MLTAYAAKELHRRFSQGSRVPTVRFYFLFEEPLHTLGMISRSAFSQQPAYLFRHNVGPGLALGNGHQLSASANRLEDTSRIKDWLLKKSYFLLPQSPVVNPKQGRCCHSYPGYRPPDSFWLMRDFSKVVNEHAPKLAADQRADTDG